MQSLRILNYVLILSVLLLTIGINISEAEMTVHDKNHQLIGVYFGNSSNNTLEIYIPSYDRSIHINVSTGDILGQDFYFESSDCSGIAYVVSEASYKVIKNGESYFTGEKVAPINTQINSVFRSYTPVCELYNGMRYVVPALSVELPFTLPVALPLSFEFMNGRWKK